jgi:hypothetical protein
MNLLFKYLVVLAIQVTVVTTALGSEVWVKQGLPGVSMTGSGTFDDPYLVAPDIPADYDSVVSSLSANTKLHLGAGSFLTSGYTGGVIYPDGTHVEGEGEGVTIVKLKANAIGSGQMTTTVHVGTSLASAKFSASVKSLTIDCNFSHQDTSSLKAGGIGYTGFGFTVENVEIINLGGRNGNESFGIFGGNFGSSATGHPSHVIIKNCRIHKPYNNQYAYMTAIHPSGDNKWSGTIENCFVDLSDANYPVSGAYGIAFAGSAQHLVVRSNTVIGCTRGFHFDSPSDLTEGPNNVVIINNRFSKCLTSVAIGWNGESLAGNVLYKNFIIEGNSMEMKGGVGILLSNRCRGFFIRNNICVFTPDTDPSTYCHTVALDANAAGNVICGNRYGPSNVGNQIPMVPVSYDPDSDVALNNQYFDNDWLNATNSRKVIEGYRFPQPGNSIPTGTGFWQIALGSGNNDGNPTTEILSSDYDKTSNIYSYMRLGRSHYNPWGSYNVILDPAGISGAWVGTLSGGNFGAGGWVQANSGFFVPPGSRLVWQEGGSNARMGTVTLGMNGEALVNTSAVKADTRIFLTIQEPSGTPGSVQIQTRTPGTSFLIKSSDLSDRSTVAWFMIDSSF